MMDVLYIAGSGRSGSTLLERILGQLDGVAAVGELRHLWRNNPESELCGCGAVFANCPFWTEVLSLAGVSLTKASFESVHHLQLQVDRMRYIPTMLGWSVRPGNNDRLVAEYTALLSRLYGALLQVSGAHLIVDSSKDVSTLYLLTTMEDVRLRVLHPLRDSRAVAFSWMRQRVERHVVDHTAFMPVYSPQKSAMDWNYRNVMSEWAGGRASGYLQFRYEDLVDKPLEVIGEITSFAELSNTDLGFIHGHDLQLWHDNHTASGNPMRFDKGSIRLKLDSAWRDDLKASDRRIVTSLTWPLLRKYGYV